MCIRDSYRAEELTTLSRGDYLSQFQKAADDARDAVQSNGCLLYTSDAADDLLCVDLGGRRIIKKKKYTILQSLTNIHPPHISSLVLTYTRPLSTNSKTTL